MAEWAQEKIRVNKGFLVERLTSEEKWKQNCIDLEIPLTRTIVKHELLNVLNVLLTIAVHSRRDVM